MVSRSIPWLTFLLVFPSLVQHSLQLLIMVRFQPPFPLSDGFLHPLLRPSASAVHRLRAALSYGRPGKRANCSADTGKTPLRRRRRRYNFDGLLRRLPERNPEMKKIIARIKMAVRVIERLPIITKIIEVTAESVKIARKNLRAD